MCSTFGPDVTSRFLDANRLAVLVRSHEVPANLRGFEVKHDNRVVTVFSASNYCGSMSNFGAVLKIRLKGDAAATAPEDMEMPFLEKPGCINTNGAPACSKAAAVVSPRSKSALVRLGTPIPALSSTRVGLGLVRPLGLCYPTKAPITHQTLPLPRLESLTCTAHEHWAPQLAELPADLAAPRGEPAAQQQRKALERRASCSPRDDARMRHDIVEKVRSRIVEKRSELMWHYRHLTKEGPAGSLISLTQWQQGLQAVLDLDIPWLEYCDALVTPEADGFVDYRRFLRRFRVAFAGESSLGPGRTSHLFDLCVAADMSLEEAFAVVGGRVTEADWVSLVQRSGLAAISFAEVQDCLALVCALGTTPHGSLSPDDLVALFAAMHSHSKHGQAIPLPYDYVSNYQGIAQSCVNLFRELDSSGTGCLSYGDFKNGLVNLWRRWAAGTEDHEDGHLQTEDLLTLAESLDPVHRGHIALLPFCQAFYGIGDHSTVDTMMQTLLVALYENNVTLRRVCRFYDDDEDGVITVQEFNEALGALNGGEAARGRLFTPLHAAIVAAQACRAGEKVVRYAEVLDSLVIVDTEEF